MVLSKKEQLADQRRHPRAIFANPVEFKVFSGNPVSFDGYLKDISRGDACLQFEDKYGRLNFDKVNDSQLRLSLSMPVWRGKRCQERQGLMRLGRCIMEKTFLYGNKVLLNNDKTFLIFAL